MLARFKREAQAAGRLNHPGIVAVYDYGEAVAQDDQSPAGGDASESIAGQRVAFIALGLVFVGAVAGVGLSALIASEPWLFAGLRWAGAIYLLYLAYDAWRSRGLSIVTNNQANCNDWDHGFFTCGTASRQHEGGYIHHEHHRE